MHASRKCLKRTSLSLALLCVVSRVPAGDPAPGFVETDVATGLQQPTAIAFLPGGGLLITEQGGNLILAEGGGRTVLASIPVCGDREMGLLGIAVHPDFPGPPHIYLYRTISEAGNCEVGVDRFNQVVRVSLTERTVDLGSLTVLLSGIRTDTGYHNGGGLRIGPDEKLYVSVGDTGTGDFLSDFFNPPGSSTNPYADDVGALEGKILRLELDGTIPADNPLVDQGGARGEIHAWGFRNPFRFGFDPETGALWCGDVGEDSIEEISLVEAGKSHGWPRCEGKLPAGCRQSGDVDPVFTYPHEGGDSLGLCVVGGAPAGAALPSLADSYFFADYGSGFGPDGKIYRVKLSKKRNGFSGSPEVVVDRVDSPVDLVFDSAGRLHYVSHAAGAVHRVEFSAGPPPPEETFVLEKGTAKQQKKTGTFSLKSKGRYQPGLPAYNGDLSEFFIQVNGTIYFDAVSRGSRPPKEKKDGRTGNTRAFSIRDDSKNQCKIDLSKGKFTVTLKATPPGFDPTGGVTLEVVLGNTRATLTAPAQPKGKKLIISRTTGAVAPVD